MGRHGRLIYKKGIIDLLKFLDNRLVPRSANAGETTLVTNKLGLIFSNNRLIYPNIRKKTSMGRNAGPYAVPSRQNNTKRTRLLTCRKKTFLETYRKVKQGHRFGQRIISCPEVSVLDSIITGFLQSIYVIIRTPKSL